MRRDIPAYGLPASTLQALRQAAPDGFERTSDRRWVSEPRSGIRRILEFQAMKGAQYSATWGFGVDFVPKFRRGRFSWKRTARSADFDVPLDPIDDAGIVPRWCSLAATDSAGRVAAVARDAWTKASQDFSDVVTIADLLELVRVRAAMTFPRFGPRNYVQTDLARGLLQIAVGDIDEGMTRLSMFASDSTSARMMRCSQRPSRTLAHSLMRTPSDDPAPLRRVENSAMTSFVEFTVGHGLVRVPAPEGVECWTGSVGADGRTTVSLVAEAPASVADFDLTFVEDVLNDLPTYLTSASKAVDLALENPPGSDARMTGLPRSRSSPVRNGPFASPMCHDRTSTSWGPRLSARKQCRLGQLSL